MHVKLEEDEIRSSKDEASPMTDLASMLHSVFFGVFSALREEHGFFGGCEYAIEKINNVNGYLKFKEGKSIEDIVRTLEKTGLYQGLEFNREGDTAIFSISRCFFAEGEKGIHTKLNMIDVPCPLALFVAAFVADCDRSKRVYVYPTVYTPEGCKTEFGLLSPEEYEQKKKTHYIYLVGCCRFGSYFFSYKKRHQ